MQVNIKYLPELEKNGLMFVGHDVEGQRMEILELKSQLLFRSFLLSYNTSIYLSLAVISSPTERLIVMCVCMCIRSPVLRGRTVPS